MLVTSRTIASESRSFCSSDLPGQSFTMTCGICLLSRLRSEILLVSDRLHPGHRRPIDGLLNGDVGHGLMRRRTVPVLVLSRTPEDVPRMKLQLRTAVDLGPADAFCHDQGLPGWMGVPNGACSRFEMHDRAADAGWLWPLKLARDRCLASEKIGGSFHRLHVVFACNFHSRTPFRCSGRGDGDQCPQKRRDDGQVPSVDVRLPAHGPRVHRLRVKKAVILSNGI